MSASSEDTRTGRKANDLNNRPPTQPRPSAGSRDGTPSNAPPPRRTGGKAQGQGKMTSEGLQNGPRARDESAGRAEESTGVNGTTSEASITAKAPSDSAKPMLYKPDPKAQAAVKADQPWGTKPGTMANGKDFWLELRKQVTSLQQSGGTSLGG